MLENSDYEILFFMHDFKYLKESNDISTGTQNLIYLEMVECYKTVYNFYMRLLTLLSLSRLLLPIVVNRCNIVAHKKTFKVIP